MAPRVLPPFRADHVGSLLRPPALLQARGDLAAGTIDGDELRAIEDDGDPGRGADAGGRRAAARDRRRVPPRAPGTWTSSTSSAASRASRRNLDVQFRNEEGDDRVHAVRRCASTRRCSSSTRSSARPSSSCDRSRRARMPKLTIPSPSMVHYRGGRAAIDRGVYPDLERSGPTSTDAYAEEVRRLARARLHLPAARRHEPRLPERPGAARARRRHRRRRRAPARGLHRATSTARSPTGRPAWRSRTHLCRGNFRSSWFAEGGYDFVAEALFNELDVDGFFLEYDDARSGGFEPLRFVPKGKTVVLGLVTTKRRRAGAEGRRSSAASRRPRSTCRLEQLCLSPQCGFSSTVEGNELSYDEQVAKLRLVVETAQEVWGEA